MTLQCICVRITVKTKYERLSYYDGIDGMYKEVEITRTTFTVIAAKTIILIGILCVTMATGCT